MSTGAEHYKEAERLLIVAEDLRYQCSWNQGGMVVAMADVHARLAAVQASRGAWDTNKPEVTVPPARREPLTIGDYPG